MGSQPYPVRVPVGEDGKERVAAVSCGSSHTVVSTAVMQSYQGGGDDRIKVLSGGRAYVAGSSSALGEFYPTFTLVKSLVEQGHIVQSVAAGHCHSGVLTTDGALFCWGRNTGGCCGQPKDVPFLREPQCVRFLYDLPVNLCLSKKAMQSSTLGKMKAELAIDGKVQPEIMTTCSCTRADNNAWWQVDLGEYCMVQTIRIHNRGDLAQGQDPLKHIKRLFPCWIMVSREPYNTEAYGMESFEVAARDSVAKKRFVEVARKLVWHLPEGTLCRYVRIQLEQQNFLNLAQVEVLGNVGIPFTIGHVTHVQCGRNVTVAVVGPTTKPEEVRAAYKRAVQADTYNADILRQFETYMPEWDKLGRGEDITGCSICHTANKCERCVIYQLYKDELGGMPLGPGGRLRRFRSVKDFLLLSGQPPLEYEEPERYKAPTLTETINKVFRRPILGRRLSSASTSGTRGDSRDSTQPREGTPL